MPRALLAALGCVVVSAAFASRGARAADCGASAYYPSARTRESALVEGGELAANGRWADARAVYLWVLARHEDDAEALFGLARVDAWGGCWAIAESEYRRVLATHPGDADVRAGYVDLLVWRGRLDDAERVLAQGMTMGPKAPPALLARAARFAYWRGDAGTAVRLADEAERGAPDDADIKVARDRMFRGEARLTAHLDVYPSTYPSLVAVAGQALERLGRFEFSLGAQMLERLSASTTKPVVDGRYPLGAVYHPAIGAALGVEIAPGAPANAIPDMAAKGFALVPILGPMDGLFSYSLWHYASGELVNIFNPSLGVALPAELRFEARTWISWVFLHGQSQVESALGGELIWSPTPRVTAAATYTYGAEVDQAPTLYQLLEYRSHVAGGFADILFDRKGGVRPALTLERREGGTSGVIWIESFEIGAYARW
jgi:tetratricopeptide (TPR) repeat protein